MRILITGSRDWTDAPTIAMAMRRAIQSAHATRAETVIVHGACPRGADKLADAIASNWGATIEAHPADWSIGRSAGFKRNKEMVDLGADVCLAFIKNNSNGASHTAKLAQAAGIPTEIYRE